jgi:hypothetical protein
MMLLDKERLSAISIINGPNTEIEAHNDMLTIRILVIVNAFLIIRYKYI